MKGQRAPGLVELVRDGPVALVTMGHPPVNALSRALVEELTRVFRELESDRSVRSVVLRGAGRAFAAGADITEFPLLEREIAGETDSSTTSMHDLHSSIEDGRLPVVCGIHGYCLGGGLELAMACDIRVAADDAQFGQPEVKLGLLPGAGGTQRLPRLVGHGRALLMNLSGDPISAGEAYAYGLVQKVVPSDRLEDESVALARMLAGRSPHAVAEIKRLAMATRDSPLDEGLAYEVDAFLRCFLSDDGREGVSAFLEKREPRWAETTGSPSPGKSAAGLALPSSSARTADPAVAFPGLFSLKGRTALVTGASRGIGAQAAQVLDAAGANLVLVARSGKRLEALAERLSNDARVIVADLSLVDEVRRVGDEAGHVDILVNNASLSDPGPSLELTLESWEMTQALNLRSAFFLAQALAPQMIEHGWGRIVNVASVMSFVGDATAAAYASSKAGILGLTRTLGVEWARHGVTVNALCPGWIDTDMVAELRQDERFERRVLRRVPVRRWGTPDDLDGAILFLSSAASGFMTGQTLVVDGGLTATW